MTVATAFPGHAICSLRSDWSLARTVATVATAFPGHAGRYWPLARWRSLARTVATVLQ